VARMAMTRENSPVAATSNDPVQTSVNISEPMGSLYEVTRLRNIRSNQARTTRKPGVEDPLEDFISRGVIAQAEAEELYAHFHRTLNHYLWVGLEEIHSSLDSVRRSSSLLAATILTVTALHIPTSVETFDKCYLEFLALVSSSMFSRYHSIDDVRGLCIAAFWLSDVSWKLCGHAIRIATELNIHQSFYRALEGDRDHFLRSRLWYMLYVCDHHFSIAYGRPPMISESLQIREHETFLRSPLAGPLDMRILSQVALFQILTKAHDCFAEQRLPHQQAANPAALPEAYFPQLRGFNLEIDQWRIRWQSRQIVNRHIGSFPPMGNVLYSYFAKLQLNSLAIKGINVTQGKLTTERKDFANLAISAATSILTFILEEPDLRRALVGTPLYVHTMIAFASVFLMKIAAKGGSMGLNLESVFVWNLIERMIDLLQSSVTSDRHLLYHIAAGLEQMLAKSRASTPQIQHASQYASTAEASNHIANGQALDNTQFSDFPHSSHGSDLQGHTYTGHDGHQLSSVDGMDLSAETDFDQMILNDAHIWEAFGSQPDGGVYNLLSNQFSYFDGSEL